MRKSKTGCWRVESVTVVWLTTAVLAFITITSQLLAKRSCSLYAVSRYDHVVCLSVCLWCSCTLLSLLKFSVMFLCHLVPWPSVDKRAKFYGDSQGVKHKRGGQI